MAGRRNHREYPVELGVVVNPVEYIAGVWRFSRTPGGFSLAHSTPGHLVHYIIHGAYTLTTDLRTYRVKAGDVIVYHGTESVECRWDGGAVEFYSIAFEASALPPLPLDRRVFAASRRAAELFAEIYAISQDAQGDPVRLRLFAGLYALLAELDWPALPAAQANDEDIWARVERWLRAGRRFRAGIDELAAQAHCSRATLARLCRRSTGMSPQARLRELRLAEARGLLMYSPLTIACIAEHLGYTRQHEFTREFTRHFGHPPSRLRKG